MGREVLLVGSDEVQPFDPDGRLFKSVNTPEELAEAQKLLAEAEPE